MSTKADRVEFVTGFDGSTPLDIVATTILPTLIGVLLVQEIDIQSTNTSTKFAVEFTLVIMPVVLSQMRLGLESPLGLSELLYISPLIFSALKLLKRRQVGDLVDKEMKSRKIVTMHRSAISVMTYVAILAVDFRAFPREFCKCEVYGYGLMDLGTASFVFASGLCSPWSRGKSKTKTKTQKENKTLLRSALKSLPLFILGAVRCAATKGLDYQEHVSEYGTHWNFFFTLCAINFFSEGLLGYSNNIAGWRRRFIILLTFAIYQVALTGFGLQKYVEREGRTENIFDMNREGLLGTLGYTCVFVVAEFIGRVCFWRGGGVGKWEGGNVLTGVAALAWIIFTVVSDENGLNLAVSRRTTNAAYVCWAVCVNTSLLLGLAVIVRTKGEGIMIFESINRNGLVVFLLANLLTGAVNLSIDTLAVSNHVVAIEIVGVYMGVVCGVAVVLDKCFDLTLKL
ncbi:hypothetical protein TL16_g08458 [Triparma laevis f. inornata]|uniref:GPI-anchored wall transfer protein n=2 Tax=Triparma laevis TaxID=1534972 RepID=A0A9W7F0Z9_9STRA|nr:hypothetical protein TL16_g08458 [Triparma laevis f. inornata]GMH99664.1 hypothetical protein TrLO_g1735 [Triparma laevis f. longispina]